MGNEIRLGTSENTGNYTLDSAIQSLMTSLIVNEETAKNIITLSSIFYKPEEVYTFLTYEFPHVINYHVNMIAENNQIHRYNDGGSHNHRLGVVGTCVLKYEFPATPSCFAFSSEFRKFFDNALFLVIEKYLEKLLFGIQGLHLQIGIHDFEDTFKRLQTLNEAGIASLLDFSWHCKGHRMYEIIDGKESNSTIYSARFDNIPKEVQLALADQPGFPDYLRDANAALQKVLFVSKTSRIEILQKCNIDDLKVIPQIGTVLREKAVLIKLMTYPPTTNQSFRTSLMFNTIPTDLQRDMEWVRRFLLTRFADKITELFFSDELIKQVMLLPNMRCQAPQVNCFGTIRQKHNIDEYVRGLEALGQGSPLPPLQFRTAPLLPAPSLMEESLIPQSVVGFGIFAIGAVGLTVARSCYRQWGFWSKTLGFNKNKPQANDKSVFTTTSYKRIKQ